MPDDTLPPDDTKDPQNSNVIEFDAGKIRPIWERTAPRWRGYARLCGLAHCERAHFCKNLCNPHYQLARLGTLDPETGLSVRQTKAAEAAGLPTAEITPEFEIKNFGKLKDWVYITQTAEFVNINTHVKLTYNSVLRSFGNAPIQLMRADKIKKYMNWTFTTKECGPQEFNSYRPELVMGITNHSMKLPSQIEALIDGLGGKHRRYLEQWLNYTIFNRGNPGCALVLYGIHGSGKSTLGMLLKEVFGLYATTPDMQAIEEKHNSWIETKLLIVAEEIVAGSFREQMKTMNQMKKLISGGQMIINRKGVPQYEYENVARWLLLSNAGAIGNEKKPPVIIEPTERRYSFIRCDKELSKDIGANIGRSPREYAQALVNYLSTVEMHDFEPWHALQNEELSEVRELSKRHLHD